jgi:hypothetical protein
MKNLLLAVAVLPFRIAPAFASDGHESEPGHRQLSYPRWVPLRSGGYYVREPVTLQNGEWSTARGSGLQRRQRKLAARNFRGYGFLDHPELDCSVQGLVSGSNLRGARRVRRRAQVSSDRRYWPRSDSADQCGSAPRT